MSDIEAFQSRIMAAMDKLAAGIERLDPSATEETAALKEALADEKTVNAQLSERVRVLGDRQERVLSAMEKKSQEAAARMDALDLALQRVRQANAELRSACEALRDANAEGVGEPHLINRAMAAELDAMKAVREMEVAEADEIIAALTPLVKEGAARGKETPDA